jgi:hypothetical protein
LAQWFSCFIVLYLMIVSLKCSRVEYSQALLKSFFKSLLCNLFPNNTEMNYYNFVNAINDYCEWWLFIYLDFVGNVI